MANLILQNQGTVITWDDTGTTHAFTLANLAASGNGRQGVEHDFGVAAVPQLFMWMAYVQWETNAVVGDTVDIYLKTSPDGAKYDNDDGDGTDIAVSAENKLKNLWVLGSIVADEVALVHMQTSGGPILIGAEKVAPVFWNASADNLITPATTESGFRLVPVPNEVQ